MKNIFYIVFIFSLPICLPGSGMCKNNELQICDNNGEWISIDCPDGTSCSLINGKIGCNNQNRLVDIVDDEIIGKNLNIISDIENEPPKTYKNKKTKLITLSKSKKKTMHYNTKTVTITKQKNKRKLSKNKKHKLQNHTNINNDNLLKTISDLINKANNVTITKTITIQTPPKEIKLEYSAPNLPNGTTNIKLDNMISNTNNEFIPHTILPNNIISNKNNPTNNNNFSNNKLTESNNSNNNNENKSNEFNNPNNSNKSNNSNNNNKSNNNNNNKPGESNNSNNNNKSNNNNNNKPGESNNPNNSNGNKSNESNNSNINGNIIDKETLNKVMLECGFQPQAEFIDVVVKGVNKSFKDKSMAAQFLAQCAHESGGYKYIEEIACAGNKCPGQYGSDQGAPGKQYYGRGFIQLSWPANYKAASQKLYNNTSLYDDPDSVAKDLQKAYDVSEWFWKTNVEGKEGVGPDHFGYTTKAINGELECKNNNNIDKSKKRYEIYVKLAKAMKLEKVADEKGCYTA